MEYLHSAETKKIISLIYEVRNEMKGGWSEEVYHRALYELLIDHKIPVLHKPRKELVHRNQLIYTFEADLIVWDKIILELKVDPAFRGNQFPSHNQAQIIHYLKCFEKQIGLLVNFAHSKVGVKRMIYQLPEMEVIENYDYIQGVLNQGDRLELQEVRQKLLTLVNGIQTGYSEIVYNKIVCVELAFQGFKVESNLKVPAYWQNKRIGQDSARHILVNDKFLILTRATLEHPPTIDFVQTKTYLESLGLKIGLVINFGKNKVQIKGVSVNQNFLRSIPLKRETETNSVGRSLDESG